MSAYALITKHHIPKMERTGAMEIQIRVRYHAITVPVPTRASEIRCWMLEESLKVYARLIFTGILKELRRGRMSANAEVKIVIIVGDIMKNSGRRDPAVPETKGSA